MGMNVGSLQATIIAIGNQKVSMRQAASTAVGSAGRALKAATRANLSAKDFTLVQLEGMDHPYARRHGSIRVNKSGGTGFLNKPENRVHNRSGSMRRALKSKFVSGTKPQYTLSMDTSLAPHARGVILGTNVMLPRDVLWDTATSPKMREKMMREMVLALGKKLRSQAHVRFGTASVGSGLPGVV